MSFKKVFLLIIPLLVLSSCNKTDNSSQVSDISSEESSTEITSNEENSSEEISEDNEYYSLSIDLKNSLSAVDVSQSSSASGFIESSFNRSENIVFSNFIYDKVYCDNGGVKLSSSSSYGTLTFSSNKTIKNIYIYGRPYAKMNTYIGELNVDSDALIGVNDNYSEKIVNVVSENDSFEYAFENIDGQEISISSSSLNDGKGRFTIFSLKIDYIN